MMRTGTPVGLALTLIAGVMYGNCMLPIKFVRTWKWENVWAIFSIVSLTLLPWSLALALVKDLEEVYRTLKFAQIAVPLALGAGKRQKPHGSSVLPAFTPEQIQEESREWLPKKDRLRRCDIWAGKTTADANISAVGPKKGDEVRGEIDV